MGKVEDNKKLKMNTLLQTAFDLFTGKGFAKTTVSDIVNQAGLAKGTFYLYFKDKSDLRDKLIAFKASQLFDDAHKALDAAVIPDFEEEILFPEHTSSDESPLLRLQAEPSSVEMHKIFPHRSET